MNNMNDIYEVYNFIETQGMFVTVNTELYTLNSVSSLYHNCYLLCSLCFI